MYCDVLYCIVMYCIVLYCDVLYCIVLYCAVLCCAVPDAMIDLVWVGRRFIVIDLETCQSCSVVGILLR